MNAEHPLRPRAILASLTALVPLACGSDDAGPSAPAAHAPNTASKSAAKVEPFTYPPPVSGHYSEVNTGDFDLVDGLAYTATPSGGTVVYVTSKSIASPILAHSSAPMTDARAIALLRDAAYLEVTLDAADTSSYFAGGTQLGGRGREEDSGGRYWTIETKNPAVGRAAASVVYRDRGSFEFDLPVVRPNVTEVSEGDRVAGRRSPEGSPAPSEAAVLEVYRAVHAAARAKDLAALLAAQGFSAQAISAIRGLPGIDADFALFVERFLDPGEAHEPTVYEGYGGVGGSGVNSKGEKFSNYYEFTPCGDRLVLIGISENAQ